MIISITTNHIALLLMTAVFCEGFQVVRFSSIRPRRGHWPFRAHSYLSSTPINTIANSHHVTRMKTSINREYSQPDDSHHPETARTTTTPVRPSADDNRYVPQPCHHRRQFLKRAVATVLTLTAITASDKSVCWALAPQQASQDYDGYASTYDDLDGGSASSALGIDQARGKLMGQASGHVLEIGAGTGLNLDKYNLQQIKSLTLVDISEGMLQEAKKRVNNNNKNSQEGDYRLGNVPIRFVQADATSQLVSLFGDESFDTVVDSFSLCVMGNQGAQQCLGQMSRVTKAGGQLLLLENSRSSNPLLGMYQDVTADAAASAGGKGCVYNQNVGALIAGTLPSLTIDQEELYAAGLFRAFHVSKVAV